MPRVYHYWDKLVGAVFKRETFRQLAFAESSSSSDRTNSSSDSSCEDSPVKNVPAVEAEKTNAKVYGNWERLAGAVLRREELRQLAFSESSSSITSGISSRFRSSVSSDISSRFSFESTIEAVPTDPTVLSRQINFSYHDVRPIEFTEIIKATKNFQPDMLFEQGEFGQYFKGWVDEHTLTASMPGSGMPVAVKKCHQEWFQGRQEFLEEVNYLSQLHHPNLVKLIGYCCEEAFMILVYEFMPNGRLEHHLFTRGYESLSWERRMKVAIGASRGLSFLHEKEIPVLCGSFTSDSILLDEEFNAKLSDFRLTREDSFPDMNAVPPGVIGCGYAAPEYITTGEPKTRYDVLGFGVLLLELLSGLQAYTRHPHTKEQTLVEWARPYLGSKRKLLRIMDTRLDGQYHRKEAYKVAKLASKCLSLDPNLRPPMSEVVAALEKLRVEDQYPCKREYKVAKLARWLRTAG